MEKPPSSVPQIPGVKYLKPDESEIRENREFSEAEIMAVIAEMDGIDASFLTVQQQVRNADNIIVISYFKLKDEVAKERFKSSVEYGFMLKGSHGPRNQSATTNIDRTLYSDDGMPEGGEILAEYLEGKWVKQG